MISQLSKHAGTPSEQKEFEQTWENNYAIFEPLLKMIRELAPRPKITKADFELPAFTEKLIYDQAQYDLAEKIIAVFPKKLLT